MTQNLSDERTVANSWREWMIRPGACPTSTRTRLVSAAANSDANWLANWTAIALPAAGVGHGGDR
eukprot:11222194-Lingulodinium_polyedra.AAC.1